MSNKGYAENSAERKWNVVPSAMSLRTVNPIRRIIDRMKLEPNPELPLISLSIGDPTVFGNLIPHENILVAVEESLRTHKHNGYAPAIGELAARKAIAELMSNPKALLTEQDIIITSACSGAIDICLSTLANPGDSILIPKPGFSLYKTLGFSNGLEVKQYNLLPDCDWEVDLAHLESLIDETTKCIIVNNPSNPCGSVYSKEHLEAIISVAEKHKVLILADEIYAYSVFPGETFYPMASLTETVPILSCCAISKRFLVPGWRLGWIQIHDRNNILEELRCRLFDMSTRILGANTIIQGALPRIFSETPKEWLDSNMQFIKDNATIAYSTLSKVKYLKPIQPRGAMYMMVGLDKELLDVFEDDINFTQRLIVEKSVHCLPASCFDLPGFFRIVLTVPSHLLEEACNRIADFCEQQEFK
ncbi:tyrosine aminotransferase-like [Hydra vulgaris]|uniref:Tyrosine aminotransferase n=1 Tax=Hydra vulgaris TaxID=6087 RepID=A0ABM4DP16_HYDVU